MQERRKCYEIMYKCYTLKLFPYSLHYLSFTLTLATPLYYFDSVLILWKRRYLLVIHMTQYNTTQYCECIFKKWEKLIRLNFLVIHTLENWKYSQLLTQLCNPEVSWNQLPGFKSIFPCAMLNATCIDYFYVKKKYSFI